MAKKLDFDKEKNNRNDNAIEEIMQADFPLPKQAEDAKNEAFSRIREMAAASGHAENTENMVQRLQEKSTEKSTGSSGKKSTGTAKSHKKFKTVYKTVYKTALGLTAAAAVFSAVCITNPAFAENIPLVGNVFKQLGNSLGFYGDYSKYAKQLTHLQKIHCLQMLMEVRRAAVILKMLSLRIRIQQKITMQIKRKTMNHTVYF